PELPPKVNSVREPSASSITSVAKGLSLPSKIFQATSSAGTDELLLLDELLVTEDVLEADDEETTLELELVMPPGCGNSAPLSLPRPAINKLLTSIAGINVIFFIKSYLSVDGARDRRSSAPFSVIINNTLSISAKSHELMNADRIQVNTRGTGRRIS